MVVLTYASEFAPAPPNAKRAHAMTETRRVDSIIVGPH
jgi:hypothetical protein